MRGYSCFCNRSYVRIADTRPLPKCISDIVNISKSQGFYFVNIQSALTEEHLRKIKTQKDITINIPTTNNALESLEPLFNEINAFYKK